MSKLYKGTHTDHRRVTVDRCKSIMLESDSTVPFHIDGDVRGSLPITVTVRPKALKIVVP
jgi:diacylglycerol kinase family enzyme